MSPGAGKKWAVQSLVLASLVGAAAAAASGSSAYASWSRNHRNASKEIAQLKARTAAQVQAGSKAMVADEAVIWRVRLLACPRTIEREPVSIRQTKME